MSNSDKNTGIPYYHAAASQYGNSGSGAALNNQRGYPPTSPNGPNNGGPGNSYNNYPGYQPGGYNPSQQYGGVPGSKPPPYSQSQPSNTQQYPQQNYNQPPIQQGYGGYAQAYPGGMPMNNPQYNNAYSGVNPQFARPPDNEKKKGVLMGCLGAILLCCCLQSHGAMR